MGDERGAVTAFVVTFTVALLGVAGLVADGGFVLAAYRRAADEAEAAARAGTQALDESALRGGGTVALDPDAAQARALDYLAATGHRGRVDVTGDTVRVEVSFERDLTLLRMFGLGPVTVSGEGEAHGVRGP